MGRTPAHVGKGPDFNELPHPDVLQFPRLLSKCCRQRDRGAWYSGLRKRLSRTQASPKGTKTIKIPDAGISDAGAQKPCVLQNPRLRAGIDPWEEKQSELTAGTRLDKNWRMDHQKCNAKRKPNELHAV